MVASPLSYRGWTPTKPEVAGPEGPTRDVRIGALVFLVYLAGGVVVFWHVWAHPATFQPGYGTGDTARYDWFVAWVPYAIAHGLNPFVTHAANYPFGVNLMDDTSVLALALVASPITVLFGPVASVNVLATLAFPLAAGAAYLLARRYVSWRPAAFAAGLLYGFGPYMAGQGPGHLNLSFVPLPPLILLALDELFVRQRGSAVKWGVGLGLMVAIQFMISTEITATTALFAVIATVVAALWNRREVRSRLRHAAVGIGAGGAVAVVLLALPLYYAFLGPDRITGRIVGFEDYYSALLAPLLPTDLMLLGTHHMKVLGGRIGGNLAENGTYLGVPLVLLSIVAPFLVRRRVARIAAVSALIVFVFSLGRNLHIGVGRFTSVSHHAALPGEILFLVPKLNDAFPVRYALFVALFLSVLLAVTLDAVHSWADRRASPAAVAVAVVALFPLIPAWPTPAEGNVGVPSYFTTSAVKAIAPGTVTVVYPVPTNANASGMLWQAEAGMRFKMVGGYFVVPAPGGSQFFTPSTVQSVLTDLAQGKPPDRTPALKTLLTDQLRLWKVGAVVAAPTGSDPQGFFQWLTGRAPDDQRGGLLEWYHLTW